MNKLNSSKRVLYVSSGFGDDFRCIKKIKATDYELLVATLNSAFAAELKNQGFDCVDLNPEKLPFDDWDYQSKYGFFERRKRQKIFQTQHLSSYQKVLTEFKPHLVQAGWLQTDGYLATQAKPSKLVIMPHGVNIYNRAQDNRRNLKKTRLVLSQADLLVCDSEQMENQCRRLLKYQSKSTVIFPRGVERSIFNAGNRLHHLTMPIKIVVATPLQLTSSLETLFDALSMLQASNKVPFTVDIYGEGPLRQPLESRLRPLGLNKWVKINARLSNDKLAEVYRLAHLWVSCLEAPSDVLAVIEAASCGMVPVVTDNAVYSEWIKDGVNGFVYPAQHAKALAALLQKIFVTDDATFKSIFKRNQTLSMEQFDWDKNFGKLIKSYEKLLVTV